MKDDADSDDEKKSEEDEISDVLDSDGNKIEIIKKDLDDIGTIEEQREYYDKVQNKDGDPKDTATDYEKTLFKMY